MNGRIFDRTYEGDIDITDNAELELNKFEPFPKNPPISKVFREIGYADELGSGMRNTNKYTKLYSGGVPKSAEEVPKSAEDTKLAKLDGQQLQVYNYVLANEAITTKEAKVLLGLQDRRARKILADMCDAELLMKVGATSNLKYVLKKETINQ